MASLLRKGSRGADAAPSTRAALVPFIVASLLAVAAIGIGGVLGLRSGGVAEATRDAKRSTSIYLRAVVEERLTDELLAGDQAALDDFQDAMDRLVFGDREALKRIKLWSADGRIIYSDVPALIGRRFALDTDKREALESDEPHAEISTLDGPENLLDRELGKVLEVYQSAHSLSGEQVIFETYQDLGSISGSAAEVWRPFLPWLIGSLLLLWLIQLPIAWSMASRLRARQREREALMMRSLDASGVERRRIAADLHDGPVQELAGLSYQLVAAADGADGSEERLRAALRQAAGDSRTVMRKLRALLVDIHPPNLQSEGLAAAITDLVTPMASAGIAVTTSIPDDLSLRPETEALLFRGAQEALRNVSKHAGAASATVEVSLGEGRVRLAVRDTGRGFTVSDRDRSRDEGHLGLTLIEELAAQQGGSVSIDSTPGSGTTFILEVPQS